MDSVLQLFLGESRHRVHVVGHGSRAEEVVGRWELVGGLSSQNSGHWHVCHSYCARAARQRVSAMRSAITEQDWMSLPMDSGVADMKKHSSMSGPEIDPAIGNTNWRRRELMNWSRTRSHRTVCQWRSRNNFLQKTGLQYNYRLHHLLQFATICCTMFTRCTFGRAARTIPTLWPRNQTSHHASNYRTYTFCP